MMNGVFGAGVTYDGRNKFEFKKLLIIVNNDGFVSVRGRKLDERRIYEAAFYVARFSLQINLQRINTFFGCLWYYFCYL